MKAARVETERSCAGRTSSRSLVRVSAGGPTSRSPEAACRDAVKLVESADIKKSDADNKWHSP
jgi:hypothetical protein